MTGIRAVAAVWVVLYHFQGTLFSLLPGLRFAAPVIAPGRLGVDVFFVLSGFIISYNYADRLAHLDRSRYRDFLVARLARIYPVHVLGLLMIGLLVAAAAAHGRSWNPQQSFTAAGFVGNLLMLQSFPGVEAWNIPSWSVACEAAAYLLFPLVAGLLLRVGGRTGAALTVAILAVEVVLLVVFGASSDRFAGYWVRIATEFSAGCLLWRAWRATRASPRLWDVAVVVAVAAAVLLFVTGAPADLAVPFLALVVLATANVEGPVRALLASRVMQWGGRVSYSLYIVHVPVFSGLLVLHSPRWFVTASLPIRLGLVVAYATVLLGAAALTHRLVEEPARRWIGRGRPAPDRRPGSVDAPAEA